MKAFLVISSLLILCLAFAPASVAANKKHKRIANKGSATSAVEVRAPLSNTPAADKSQKADKTTPQAKKAPKPALEKPEGFHVSVKDSRLSVNVKDQKFGDVISLIANSAGFDVDLSKDVFDMKLSTRFEETELQRGIVRLILLIDQKNYSIHYKPDGSIKTLEVHGDMASGELTLTGARPAAVKKPERTPQMGRQRTTRPPTPPAVVVPDRSRRRRISTPPLKEEIEKPDEEEKEEVLELDYKHFTPLAGQGGGDEGPSAEPAPEPAPEPTSGSAPEPASEPALGDCPDDPACNVIPEGPIPPESDLLNAPIIP